MKNTSTFKPLVILLVIAAGLMSCTKEKGINSNSKVFSVAKFRQNLVNQIALSSATQPRGYAFVINQNGVVADSVSFGSAATDPSSGSFIPMTTKTQINIASVTKTFTAIAVHRLLKIKGLTLNSKISNYLPAYWNSRQAIKDLTFQELLSHSSGLSESNTSWDSLQATCNRGLDNPLKPVDVYANINFALFRAIIPFLNDQGDAVTNEVNMNQNDFEGWMADEYIRIMQDLVFTPAGIANALCLPNPAQTNAMAFSESNFVPAVINSATPGDWTQVCGGGGYYLSALKMAQVMAYLEHTNLLLDQNQKNAMDNGYLGWDDEDSPMTYAGRAYGKDGALWWDSNGSGGQNNGDAGLQTFVIKFPNNVELVLVINSIPGGYRNTATFVKTAYDNAWE